MLILFDGTWFTFNIPSKTVPEESIDPFLFSKTSQLVLALRDCRLQVLSDKKKGKVVTSFDFLKLEVSTSQKYYKSQTSKQCWNAIVPSLALD